MAKTNPVAVCPGCRTILPDPMAAKCPACSRVLAKPVNKHFGSPDYLHHQLEDHKDRLRIESTKGPTADDKREWYDVEDALIQWARECPFEDKIACFADAELILAQLVHADETPTNVKAIVSLGKRIGELSRAIDDLYKHGGAFNHARKARPLPADAGGPDGGKEAAD